MLKFAKWFLGFDDNETSTRTNVAKPVEIRKPLDECELKILKAKLAFKEKRHREEQARQKEYERAVVPKVICSIPQELQNCVKITVDSYERGKIIVKDHRTILFKIEMGDMGGIADGTVYFNIDYPTWSFIYDKYWDSSFMNILLRAEKKE